MISIQRHFFEYLFDGIGCSFPHLFHIAGENSHCRGLPNQLVVFSINKINDYRPHFILSYDNLLAFPVIITLTDIIHIKTGIGFPGLFI